MHTRTHMHACTMHPSIHPSTHPSVLRFIYPFIHPSVSMLVNIDICKCDTSIYWNNRNANMWNNILCYVGNKAKGGISKRVFQENKEHKFSEKRTFLIPWYAHVGFSENLVGFFFWKHLFWDLPIALNIIISMFINPYQLFWQKLPSKIKKYIQVLIFKKIKNKDYRVNISPTPAFWNMGMVIFLLQWGSPSAFYLAYFFSFLNVPSLNVCEYLGWWWWWWWCWW